MNYKSTLINYEGIILNQDIVIDYLISIHYFEYTSDFSFIGEAHDFWEFLYVDKGEVQITAGTSLFILRKGDIIFHKPMEFHKLCSNGIIAPNLIVIAFGCQSAVMKFFENKILKMGNEESNLLAQIINEAKNTYISPLNDPFLPKLERCECPFFGSEQLIKINLEKMLITLIRKANSTQYNMKTASPIREKVNNDIVVRVLNYLEENIYINISLDDICKNNLISRSNLQKMFREKIGGGVIEYFHHLKMETAKQLIREGKHNFTEISQSLGFNSIHYFSRRFKKITGMTPTEYASSVKIRSENSKYMEII